VIEQQPAAGGQRNPLDEIMGRLGR